MVFNRSEYFLLLILLLYFLSGMTSLAYEILWVRMLSLQFGVSIFGVVLTVSVFMLGLGGGSLLAARQLRRIGNPLWLFALLELSIALFSLFMPVVFDTLHEAILPAISNSTLAIWYFTQFVASAVVLMVPALLMGAGFPLVLRLFATRSSGLGTVYGVNTIGAALGALLPLLLLPALGWHNTLYCVAAVSFSIALASGILSRGYRGESVIADRPVKLLPYKIMRVNLLAYAGIGACALMLEIAWTRLFGMVFLRTEYVLAIILAVFLVGVALGSFIAHLFKDRESWFNVLPVLAGGVVILGLWLLPLAANFFDPGGFASLNEAMFKQGLVITLLTLPVTIVLGAWLPMLNRRLGGSGVDGARLYGANAVGSALGALLAGFVLTPLLGSYATIVTAAIMLVAISLVWTKKRFYVLAIPLLALCAIPVYQMVPVHQLMPAMYADTQDLYRYEDAVNITHVIARQDGQRLLLADLQRMDAASDPASVQSQKNQARLPLLLHAYPHNALFLGLGTGISISSSLVYPQLNRTAVELSQGSINAASLWFNAVNDNVVQQTRVVRDDARRFLMTSQRRYDVIVGDLFHPDLVGRSALLSRQQFARAGEHLSENGIFVQWIALNQFELKSLQIVLRTFKSVFPDAVLFVDAFRVALVGSNSSLLGLPGVRENLARLSDEQRGRITGGEGEFTWLGRYWGEINVDPGGPIQDEWAPQIEFRLPHARYSGELDLAVLLDYLLRQRPHVTIAAQKLHVDDSSYAAFERAYVATELAHRSWLALLRKRYREGQRLLKLAYQANPADRWISFAVADAALESYDSAQPAGVSELEALQSILRICPDHPQVLKRLWLLEERQGNLEKALQYRAQFSQLSPLDSAISPHLR